MPSAAMKTTTMETAGVNASSKMVNTKAVPIEVVQPVIVMVPVPADTEITGSIWSPDPEIRTAIASRYVVTVTRRQH
jgi:hypothetical protein